MDQRRARRAPARASARRGQQREAVPGGDEREQAGDVGAVVGAARRGTRRRGRSRRARRAGHRSPGASIQRASTRSSSLYSMAARVGDRGARRPPAAPPTTRRRAAPVSGSRSGSFGRGDAVDEARVELAGRDRAGDLDPRAHAHGDRQRGRDERRPRTPHASGVVPIRSARGGPPATRATSARAASRRSRIGSACSSSRAPASVGADRPARQQHRAEVGLQHRDVLGDRRLRVAQLTRGGARTSPAARRSRRCAGSEGPSAIADQHCHRRSLDVIDARREHAGHGHRQARPRRGPLARASAPTGASRC